MRNRVIVLLFCFFSCSLFGNVGQLDSLRQVSGKLNGIEKIDVLNQIASILKNELPSEAMDFAEQAMNISRTIHNLEKIAETHNILGQIFQSKHDYTNAMKSFVEALKIRNELEDEIGLAESKNFIGIVFFYQENFAQAEENLHEALEIREKMQDLSGAAQTSKFLGDVYLAKKIYGKSLEHYQKALDLNLAIENVEGAAKIANHIGLISSDLGDYEGAMVYFNMSRDLHSSLEDLPKIAEDLNNIALTLIAQGIYDEAGEENASAYDLRKQIGDEMGMAESLKNFGIIFLKTGKRSKSISSLDQSIAILEKLAPQRGIPELYKIISSTYAELGAHEKAYKNHLAFASTRDIILNQEKSKALLDLTTKYESEFAAEKQQRKIELLQIENTTSKKIRYFLFAVLGLVATLLLNVFLSYKRKQKDNKLLIAKNAEIARQKDEIDRKNTELEEKNSRLDVLNSKLVAEMAERESVEKSSFARDRFLATMSHEMRTPINIIIGLTHLLLEEKPREDQIEHLRTLQFSANNLVVFINDVLDFSKIEAGKLDLESREFRPKKTFVEIKNRFEVPALEKGVSINYDFDRKIPDRLMGDPARFNQIITNLISTSLNYTEQGNIDMRIDLEELNRKEAHLKLEIKDTGLGLEQEKIDEMFKSYTSTNGDIFEGYGSNNLTLAITKRLVDLQKGKIEVQSQPGIGTTFTVVLPFKIPLAKKEVVKEKQPITFDHLAGNRILLVEDNKINQLVVAKMLRKLGIEVTTADDGLLALEEFNNKTFDLILMDIQMPNMDGYRATAEIRKHADPSKRDIPIIALTASAFLTEKEKAKLFGMNDHVGKPFGPEELLEKISNCIEIEKSV